MTRSGSLILCATLGSALLACGSNNNNGSGAGGTSGTGGTSGAGGTSGTGTSTKDPISLVPLDNDVSGWTVDQTLNPQAPGQPMIGHTYQEVTNLIDGGVGDFYFGSYTPKEFLWQDYINSSLPAFPPADGATVTLYILQMPSAAQATGLYTDILQFSDHKNGATPWQEPSTPLVGTDSRIQDTGRQWWINFHQDVYYVELLLGPSEPAPDYTPSDDTKQAAFSFAQWIARKI